MPSRASPTTINGISSQAVAAKTGRTWQQWLEILDAAGAKKLDHKGIVRVLREKHGLGPWWQQMVTVGYEKARGLRVTHERANGFSISATKTITAPASEIFRAWTDAARRKRWLTDPIEIRKSTRSRSLRITWTKDGTNIDTMLHPKPGGKCQVAVQHDRLPSAS